MRCRACKADCAGPCYDGCACSHCWNGWKAHPFRSRLRWRMKQITWDYFGYDPSMSSMSLREHIRTVWWNG